MLKQKATFKKEQISEVASLKGAVNDLPVGDHPVGRLMFKRFEGAHIGGQVYAGELIFERLPEVDASREARELAAERGMAINTYEGSGKLGRVLVDDVRDGDGARLADFFLLVEGMEAAYGD